MAFSNEKTVATVETGASIPQALYVLRARKNKVSPPTWRSSRRSKSRGCRLHFLAQQRPIFRTFGACGLRATLEEFVRCRRWSSVSFGLRMSGLCISIYLAQASCEGAVYVNRGSGLRLYTPIHSTTRRRCGCSHTGVGSSACVGPTATRRNAAQGRKEKKRTHIFKSMILSFRPKASRPQGKK